MSRIKISNDQQALAAALQAGHRAPPPRKTHSHSHLRSVVETIGLFIFGYGATSLVLHLAAGYLLFWRIASFLRHYV